MPWKVFVMEKRQVTHLGMVPHAKPFRFSGSRRGRLLHKEKQEKLGTAGPHHHQHRHSTWAKPVQQSPQNHKSSPRSVRKHKKIHQSCAAHCTAQAQSKAEASPGQGAGRVNGWGFQVRCSGQLQPTRAVGLSSSSQYSVSHVRAMSQLPWLLLQVFHLATRQTDG